MFGRRVRELREAKGLSQAELAARAGVSRQLVGAVENGRHLPRVDAGLALAAALDASVEALSAPRRPTVEGVLGALPADGTPVRAGRVGDRLVCAPTRAAFEGWEVADGVLADGSLALHDDARPGVVAVGCDPALGLAAQLVAARSAESVLAVAASTREAVTALAGGRAHIGLVHGPQDRLPSCDGEVTRLHLSQWRVGLAAPAEAGRRRIDEALAGRSRVVQRRAGAGSQAAFERALRAEGATVPDGPVVDGHVEAAWLAARIGLAAVTIEPAAIAAGLAFHPLETHTAELWIDRAWVDEPGVRRLGEALTSPELARRLTAVGGYDLTATGTAATPTGPVDPAGRREATQGALP